MMVYLMLIGSLVQLDRMSDSASNGWGFESLRSNKYKIINPQFNWRFIYFKLLGTRFSIKLIRNVIKKLVII